MSVAIPDGFARFMIELHGADTLSAVTVKNTDTKEERKIEVDNFIPLFGLSPKLGPIANWGLEIEKNLHWI